MSEAKQIIDRVIALDIGDQIIYPCTSKSHQESLRVMLYRQRRVIADKGFPFDIKISVTNLEGKPVVKLEKIALGGQFLIIKKDGSTKVDQLRIGDEADEFMSQFISAIPSANEDRISQMQREDGWTEDEIAEYKQTGEEPESVRQRREIDCAPDLSPEE